MRRNFCFLRSWPKWESSGVGRQAVSQHLQLLLMHLLPLVCRPWLCLMLLLFLPQFCLDQEVSPWQMCSCQPLSPLTSHAATPGQVSISHTFY